MSETEYGLADFFLEHDFTVQLVDHFSPLRIERLNWGFEEPYVDKNTISLADLNATLQIGLSQEPYHLGLSLGGYVGLSNAHLFKTVFSCYAGALPINRTRFIENAHKVFFFEGEHEQWTCCPAQIRQRIPAEQFHIVPGAHHSFMSFNKDKECHVYRYDFENLLVDEVHLKSILLCHESLSKVSSWSKIVIRNQSHSYASQFVKKKILEVASE